MQTEQTITLASGSTLTAYTSWNTDSSERYLTMTSPESDLSVTFLERPITQNLETMGTAAWQEIQPHFSLKPTQNLFLPSTDNWEKMCSIVYQVPTSESRYVMALVRSFKNQAYIMLIEGSTAGFSRRGAQLHSMGESWKPQGFNEISLSGIEVRHWRDDDKQNFTTFISDSMHKLNVPGVAIEIVHRDGKKLYSNAFGVKKMGSKDPITLDTLFMIGSTTKPLTTFLMATLVDQNKMSWETPITHLLSDFSLGDAALTQQLNIRHTVSAATGMPRRDLDWIIKFTGISPEDRIKQMQTMHPTTKVGETFQYSNYLVMAGGYAAARSYIATGDLEHAYAQSMQELVFDPLQMKRSVLKASDALQLGAALPHAINFSGELGPIPLHWEDAVYSVAPAGAIWSTVQDLTQYLLVEMNAGVLNKKRILNEACILERRKPGIKIGDKMAYGLGLIMGKEQGLSLIGHDGATLGFSSLLFFLPEQGIGITMLANTRYAHPFLHAVKQKFLELSFSAPLRSESLIDSAIQAQQSAQKTTRESTSLEDHDIAWIAELVGNYLSPSLGNAVLSKTTNGFELAFEEWSTRLGSTIEESGKRIITLIDGPFSGLIKLIVENNGQKLILDAGQDVHEFVRS